MINLRDQLTVFVISSGEPSLGTCLRALYAQDSHFELEEVVNVTPMDAAFQQMLDRCETPYFVQVDADMVLQPWAVLNLYNELAARPEKVAFVAGWLWDDDVQRAILGVKCYRTEICKRYPYRASASCEMNQVKRLAADGFTHEILGNGETLPPASCHGKHLASQTPEMAFRRWKRLAEKYRRYAFMHWLTPHFQRVLDRAVKTGEDIHLWQVLGAVAGLSGPLPPEAELDASRVDPDYERLETLLAKPGPTELVFYLTDRCNMKCVFDGVPCKRVVEEELHSTGEMTVDFVQKLMRQFPTVVGVCIAGFGEPLLHPHLGKICEVIREGNPSRVVGIVTNGTLLGDRAAMLAVAKPTYVSVSLNAATPEEHEATTGTKTWAKVLEGVRLARDAGLNIGLSFAVGRNHVIKIPKYLELATMLGVKFVNFNNLLPHAGENEVFLARVVTKDCPEARELEKMRSLPGARLVLNWPQPVDPDHPPGKCQSPFRALGVDAAGHITPCRRVDPPNPLYGSIYHDDPWHAPEVVNMRAEIVGDRPLGDMCRWCFGNYRE